MKPILEFGINTVSATSATVPLYWEAVSNRNLQYTAAPEWVSDEFILPDEFGPEFKLVGESVTVRTPSSHGENGASVDIVPLEFVLVSPRAVIRVYNESHGGIYLSIAAKTAALRDEIIRAALTRHPIQNKRDDRIRVNFWYVGPTGPTYSTRRLDAPNWGDIAANYPDAEELSRLVDPEWRPAHGGQLLLLQGPPGGGKTYYIRSLLKSWHRWCNASYVTDVDRFFHDSGYMMQVLMTEAGGDNWKVIILEDSGELIAKDAKEKTGQALSRLLNVADGLIGQGLKVMLLLTTNEEMDALHAAVSRSGRCAAKLSFRDFSHDEAAAWLKQAGIDKPVPHNRSLADLYALRDGVDGLVTARSPKRRLGFAPAKKELEVV